MAEEEKELTLTDTSHNESREGFSVEEHNPFLPHVDFNLYLGDEETEAGENKGDVTGLKINFNQGYVYNRTSSEQLKDPANNGGAIKIDNMDSSNPFEFETIHDHQFFVEVVVDSTNFLVKRATFTGVTGEAYASKESNEDAIADNFPHIKFASDANVLEFTGYYPVCRIKDGDLVGNSLRSDIVLSDRQTEQRGVTVQGSTALILVEDGHKSEVNPTRVRGIAAGTGVYVTQTDNYVVINATGTGEGGGGGDTGAKNIGTAVEVYDDGPPATRNPFEFRTLRGKDGQAGGGDRNNVTVQLADANGAGGVEEEILISGGACENVGTAGADAQVYQDNSIRDFKFKSLKGLGEVTIEQTTELITISGGCCDETGTLQSVTDNGSTTTTPVTFGTGTPFGSSPVTVVTKSSSNNGITIRGYDNTGSSIVDIDQDDKGNAKLTTAGYEGYPVIEITVDTGSPISGQGIIKSLDASGSGVMTTLSGNSLGGVIQSSDVKGATSASMESDASNKGVVKTFDASGSGVMTALTGNALGGVIQVSDTGNLRSATIETDVSDKGVVKTFDASGSGVMTALTGNALGGVIQVSDTGNLRSATIETDVSDKGVVKTFDASGSGVMTALTGNALGGVIQVSDTGNLRSATIETDVSDKGVVKTFDASGSGVMTALTGNALGGVIQVSDTGNLRSATIETDVSDKGVVKTFDASGSGVMTALTGNALGGVIQVSDTGNLRSATIETDVSDKGVVKTFDASGSGVMTALTGNALGGVIQVSDTGNLRSATIETDVSDKGVVKTFDASGSGVMTALTGNALGGVIQVSDTGNLRSATIETDVSDKGVVKTFDASGSGVMTALTGNALGGVIQVSDTGNLRSATIETDVSDKGVVKTFDASGSGVMTALTGNALGGVIQVSDTGNLRSATIETDVSDKGVVKTFDASGSGVMTALTGNALGGVIQVSDTGNLRSATIETDVSDKGVVKTFDASGSGVMTALTGNALGGVIQVSDTGNLRSATIETDVSDKGVVKTFDASGSGVMTALTGNALGGVIQVSDTGSFISATIETDSSDQGVIKTFDSSGSGVMSALSGNALGGVIQVNDSGNFKSATIETDASDQGVIKTFDSSGSGVMASISGDAQGGVINVNAPDDTVSVSITNDAGKQGKIQVYNAAGDDVINQIAADTSTDTFFNGGPVGLGTSQPSAGFAVDVRGTAKVQDNSTATNGTIQLGNNTNQSMGVVGGSSNFIYGAGISGFSSDATGTLDVFTSNSVGYSAIDAYIIGSSPATGSAIMAGSGNSISGHFNVIVAGAKNLISGGFQNFIGGGTGIDIIGSSIYCVSAGGEDNDISGAARSVINGGKNNLIKGSNAANIGGGQNNTIQNGFNSVIGGGDQNHISGSLLDASVIAGGKQNVISGGAVSYNFIGAGATNTIEGATQGAVIAGGVSNIIRGANNSTIAGGQQNLISNGSNSFAGGGNFQKILSSDSVVLGNYGVVQSDQEGAFVFSDSNTDLVYSSGANTLLMDFESGVFIETHDSGLYVNGGGIFINGNPVITGVSPEADTLQSVTDRGATTTNAVSLNGGASITKAGQDVLTVNRSNAGTAYLAINPFGGDAILKFQTNGTDNFAIGKDGTDTSFRIAEGGALETNPRFVIKNGGNVGIGTTDPAAPLHIQSSTDHNKLRITNDNSQSWGLMVGNSGYYQGYFMIDQVGAGQRLAINDLGYVGIGTNAPSAKLHAEGSMIVKGDASWAGTDNQNGAIFMNTAGRGLKGAFSTSYARNLILSNSNYIDLGEQSSLVYGFRLYAGSASSPVGTYDFFTSGSNSRLHIEKGGNVGIGTNSPSEKLQVSGNILVTGAGSAGPHLKLAGTYTTWEIENQYAGGANNDMFRIRNTALGSDALVINRGNNRVGIGTTNPTKTLDINGHTRVINAELQITSSSSSYTTHFNYLDGGSNYISYANGGATIFRKNSSTVASINSDGVLNVGAAGVSNTRLHVTGAASDSLARFKDGSDGVEITTRGASRQQIDFLGSNTSAINAKGSLFINYDSDNGGSNDTITFARNGVDEAGTVDMVITEGKVGIGTNNPQSRLHIGNATGNNLGLIFTNPTETVRQYFVDDSTDSDFFITYDGNGGAEITLQHDGKLALNASNGDNVGVGTVNPRTSLHVSRAGTTEGGIITIDNPNNSDGSYCGIEFINSTVGYPRSAIFAQRTGGYDAELTFHTSPTNEITGSDYPAATERMRIDHDGNVGIGTNSPSGFSSSARRLVIGEGAASEGMSIFAGTSSNASIYFADGAAGSAAYQGFVQYKHGDSRMDFGAAGGRRMIMNGNGLLIAPNGGVFSPSAELEIASSAATLRLTDTDLTNHYSEIEKAGVYTYLSSRANAADGGFIFFGGGTDTEFMRIETDGKVGIGSASPSFVLDTVFAGDNGARLRSTDNHSSLTVQSHASYGAYLRFSDGGNRYWLQARSDDKLQFRPNASLLESACIYFDETGNVGIGVSSPSQKLEVGTNTDVSAQIGRAHVGYVGFGDYAGFAHLDNASSASYALLQSAGGDTYLNCDNGNQIFFRKNNSTIGGFNSSSDFYVDTDTLYVDASADSVGINDSSPSHALDVNGIIRTQGDNKGGGLLGTQFSNIPCTTIDGFFASTSTEDYGFQNALLMNDLAGFTKWAGVTIKTSGLYKTRGGSAGSYTYSNEAGTGDFDRAFQANNNTVGSWYSDSGPDGDITTGVGSTGVVELYFSGVKSLNYSAQAAIIFGSSSFRATHVKVEALRTGAWQTIFDTTENDKTALIGRIAGNGGGANATKGLRYSFARAGSYFRINNLYAADYDLGNDLSYGGQYYIDKYYDGRHYSTLYPVINGGADLGKSSNKYNVIYGNSGNFTNGITINGNPVVTGTSAFESDTLQTVTDQGNTTTNAVTISGALTLGNHIFKSVENSFLGLYGGSDTLTNDGFIKIYGDSANWGKVQTNIGYDATNSKAHWTLNNTTELMTLKGNGRLGIGTTNPAYKLDVIDSDGGTLARFKDSDSSHKGIIIQGDTNGGSITNNTAFTSEVIYLQNSANAMRFYTDGTEAVRIDSSQRVGIGTNSVNGFTHINGRMLVEGPTVPSTLAISDSGDASKNLRLGYEPTWDVGSISASDFGAGWKNIVIAPHAGKVGIGTTSPHQPLSVKGTIVSYNNSYVQVAGMTNSSNHGRLYANNSAGVTNVLLDTNGVSYFLGGNVGIGVNDPDEKLEVQGKTHLGSRGQDGGASIEYASFSETNGGAATILGNAVYAGTANNTYRKTRSDAGNFISMTYNKGICFHTNVTGSAGSTEYNINNHEQVRITTGGSVGIGTDAPTAQYDKTLHIEGENPTFRAETTYSAGWAYSQYVSPETTWSVGIDNNDKYIIANSATLNSNVKFVIDDANGNVGIGTTNPSAHLTIAKTDPKITLYDTAGANSDPNGEITFNETATSENFAIKYNGANDRLEFNSPLDGNTGIMVITRSERVGIGITAPTAALHVNGDGGTAAKIENGSLKIRYPANNDAITITPSVGNEGRILASDGDTSTPHPLKIGGDYVRITTSGVSAATEVARFTAEGNVGIGTSSPSSLLHLEAAASPALQIKDTTNNVTFKAYAQDSNSHLANTSNHDLFIDTNNTPRITVKADGKVGIGTTSPSDKLHIEQDGGTVAIGSPTTSYGGIGFEDAALTTANSALYGVASQTVIGVKAGGAIEMKIANNSSIGLLKMETNKLHYTNGSVGIGLTNPAGDKLMVKGDDGYFASRLDGSTTAGQSMGLRVRAGYNSTDRPVLIEKADGSDVFIIDGLGNVGIGSAPSYELDVSGTTRSTYYIGGAYLEENASSSKLKFYSDGTILVMDEDGELKPCEKENDALVFGVSKKDFDSPVVLGAEPVLVTGPIKVGDYIVTSNKQGHGQSMKEQNIGTIIAQAMESGDGESYNIKAMVRKM